MTTQHSIESETMETRWTLQVRNSEHERWSSRIQSECKEVLDRRMEQLKYNYMRVVERPYNPERETVNKRGVRRTVGIRQWTSENL